MNTYRIRPQELPLPIIRLSLLVSVSVWLSGCVSLATYDSAVKDAKHARQLYQREQERTSRLTEQVKEMKLRIDGLESALRDAQEHEKRTSREYQEVQDELLRLKIAREQSRHQTKDRLKRTRDLLEQEKALLEAEADLRERGGFVSEQTRRRVQQLLEEMRRLLSALEEPSPQ